MENEWSVSEAMHKAPNFGQFNLNLVIKYWGNLILRSFDEVKCKPYKRKWNNTKLCRFNPLRVLLQRQKDASEPSKKIDESTFTGIERTAAMSTKFQQSLLAIRKSVAYILFLLHLPTDFSFHLAAPASFVSPLFLLLLLRIALVLPGYRDRRIISSLIYIQ